jgi:hypothetical protein
MIWADFKALVIDELGVDGTRRGIDALRDRAMRGAVIDLQRYIRAYRQNHKTVFNVADLTAVDFAHTGEIPDQAKPKAFYIVSQVPKADGTLPDPNCARNRLDFCAWDDRQHRMVCNQYGLRDYLYSISPMNRMFMVHPLINDQTYLLLVWDGLKMDFDDIDEVPFPEQAAEAVGAYVKWKILLEVDKRLDIAREWYDKARETGIYPNLRLKLSREQREAQDADGKDEEYTSTMPSITGFGPQRVVFLNKITQLQGLDNDFTALSAIPTKNIATPYTVEIDIGGVRQVWELRAGTDATAAGIQRGNDYAATTNEKVWYQVA